MGRRVAPPACPLQWTEPRRGAARTPPPGGHAAQAGAGRRAEADARAAARQVRHLHRFRGAGPRRAGRARMIVLDASVAVKPYLEEAGADTATELLAGTGKL